jgi:hypothetical protein
MISYLATVGAILKPFLASILSFVGGFLIALFAEPLRRSLYAPKIKVTFGDSQHFLTRTPEVTPSGYQGESLWVRVKVENTSAALARSCRAYLVNIERQGTSGSFEQTEYCESMQLGWSSQGERSYSAFDLPRKVPHFVDIMSVRQGLAGFQLAIERTPLRYGGLLTTDGTYRFTVVVSGDGVKPVRIRPTVRWDSALYRIERVDP